MGRAEELSEFVEKAELVRSARDGLFGFETRHSRPSAANVRGTLHVLGNR